MTMDTTTRPIEILLVEDNPGDIRLTIEALRECRILNNLTIAENGEEALQILRREGLYGGAATPDLILLDLNLPRKNGHEVLADIKQEPALKHIPVVILSTSGADQDIARSYELHANCFISKPVDLEQFMAVVRSIGNFWFTIVTLPTEKTPH
jgi:CheY-like chemotaxis protein